MSENISAYRRIGAQRYRETSGLYFEDFEPGNVYEHRPGRTITDVDNIWMTLLTMNTQQVHFDAAYAAKTEWKKLLVDSTFTLALLTGMSVRTVSAKVVANLGWDKCERQLRCSPAIRCMPNRRSCHVANRAAGRPRASSRSKPRE